MDTPDPADQASATASTGALQRLLASRWLMPALTAAVVLLVSLLVYMVHDALDTMCYRDLKAAGLDTATAQLLLDTGAFAKGIKNGPNDGVKWSEAMKDELKYASTRAREGRRALKRREGLSALAAVADVEMALLTAKQLAAERVNFILQLQNPNNADEFEQFRLEGKSLTGAIIEINSMLETLAARHRKLPGMCAW
ncbi:MAG TPA: hypothetical protein VJ001_14915 [Rhodocyclaceae bacterium]|nr:hypothetical protein [Rhodocyclaceae bacterium]